jgi:MraZ protein
METNPSRFRPLFLIGEQDVILDDKNRILVPADFRKEIVEAREDKTLICRIGRGRIAWLQPENYYRELIAKRPMSLMPGEDEEKYNEANYGMIFRLSWDAQGRVVMPEKIIKRTGLGKTLTLVGAGDHLAIWNRDVWERRAQTLLDTLDEISDREREAKKPPPQQ